MFTTFSWNVGLVCFHALYLLRAIPGQVQVRCNSHGDRRAGTGGDCSVVGHGGGGRYSRDRAGHMDTQHWECDIFRGGKEVGEGNGIGYTAVCSGSNVASSTKPKTGLALHPNSQKPNVKKVVSGKSRHVHRLTTSDSPGHHMPTEEKIETTGAHMISCRRRCIEYTDQTRVSVLDGQSIPSLKHINRCWPFG